MYTKVIFTILVLVLYVPKLNAGSSRVVGGMQAPLEFKTFHVSLQNLTGHHVCGGVVMSAQHLITAAHCVYGAEPQYIKAVVGTTNLDIGGKQYNISSININDEYNHVLRTNDIAILEIVGVFDLQYVQIIDIYKNELLEGDIITLSGFGAHTPNGVTSRVLYKLTLPVFSQETCRFAMRYSRNVTDSMFCTFTQIGEGSCHGDSGGPLVKNDQLVGIVSWGIPCAVGFPDVHTRITPYVNWMGKYIKFINADYTIEST